MKAIQHIVVIDLTEKAANKTIEIIEDFGIKARFSKVQTAIGLEKILEKDDIDLIILELELESQKGYKTFKQIQEVAEEAPILVYSNTQNEVIISQVLRAGAVDYLVKSETSGKQLARAVRNTPLKHHLHLALASAKIDLNKAQKRSKEAQKIARFGDWTLDIVTGEMTWSDTMYDIFRFPIGTNIANRDDFLELIYAEDKEKVNQFFSETIQSGQLQETTFRTKDKSGFQYLKARAKVQMYDSISGLVVVGTCQDITQEVQSQSAVIAQHVAGHGKKLQREMLAHLGFNIRTHLSGLANLFFLFEDTRMNAEQNALLGGMKTSFEDLYNEMHQFLNSTIVLADDLKVIPQQIRLRNFIKNFKTFVLVKENHKLDIQIGSKEKLPDFLMFDGDKLQQILLNVLRSFCDVANMSNHNVSIRLEGKKHKKNHFFMQVSLEFPGYFPFAQDDIIFSNPEAFLAQAATNEQEAEPADTDLAIAARLISILSGKMSFSTHAKNTKLSFSVPVVEIQDQVQLTASRPLYAMHILLVEDHIINQIATKKLLEKWGDITVDIANNGKIAIEKVKKTNYDLVLMDLQMPILDGIAATQIIRKSFELPIIALTAHASDEEKEKCKNIGMNDYLTKPFKPKELYMIINKTISRIAEKGA